MYLNKLIVISLIAFLVQCFCTRSLALTSIASPKKKITTTSSSSASSLSRKKKEEKESFSIGTDGGGGGGGGSFKMPYLFFPAQRRRQELKIEILQLAKITKRGLTATAEQEKKILYLFEQLEKLNPTSKPLKSNKVNGIWNLEYTTSASILGKGMNSFISSKSDYPILQMIDTKTLSAENSEVVNYFGGLFQLPNRVTAQLIPETDQSTRVQFLTFFVGPISFKSPNRFNSALDITYVDDDLRLSRGDLGNIFILTRT